MDQPILALLHAPMADSTPIVYNAYPKRQARGSGLASWAGRIPGLKARCATREGGCMCRR